MIQNEIIDSITVKPIRIQRSRKIKQVSPNGLQIKYCGRPGYYGNNYEVGSQVNIFDSLTEKEKIMFPNRTVINKSGAIYLFEKYQLPLMNLNDLKGKNLSCWCKVDEPCHVDLLLETANK